MSTAFVCGKVWPELTKAAENCRGPAAVAVAYFGEKAGPLLPLRPRSRLVVNASERVVSSGQTCPEDLRKMVARGVAVFNQPKLHAKVFVFGKTAYIGSANVSRNSERGVVEAMARTTDRRTVSAAREFVLSQCLYRLGPAELARLGKLYRPPKTPGGNRRNPGKRDEAVKTPRLFLAQLECEEWDEQTQAAHDASLPVAKKRREHPRSFKLESFRLYGKCPYERNDRVVQVTEEENGKTLVAAPGTVLHTRAYQTKGRLMFIVHLERPAKQRSAIHRLAEKLGRGSLKLLKKDGLVRNAAFRDALLKAWPPTD